MPNFRELSPIPENVLLMLFTVSYLRYFLLPRMGRESHQYPSSEISERGRWKRQGLAVFKLPYISNLYRAFEVYFLEE